MNIITNLRARAAVAVLATALVASGCSLEEASAPAVTAPSEFGLSVTLTATPDQLPRDGSAQSTITVTVRDAGGRPVSGQRLFLSTSPTTARLSQQEVTTDANGRATLTVTAPPSTALGNSITVFATPVGTDGSTAQPRLVLINLTSTANATVPSPSFTVTPASPEVNQVTTLDASATTDEGGACLDACTYFWDLGGEATRSGRIITYQFQTARIYNVALTVTDAAGTSATTRQNVTVATVARPTISFTVAPTSPTAGQQATFTATTTAATNHSVRSITWNFGDGTTTTTTNNSVVKTFTSAGTFIVTATVTDDIGQTASTSSSVTVGSGVTASFVFSPTNPRVGDEVHFNGSASTTTGSARIVSYTWDFGDGSEAETSDGPNNSHVFNAQRTFVVRLTVTDSEGRSGTTTTNLSIAAAQ